MSEIRRHFAADTSFLINLFATRLAAKLLDVERLFLLVPTAVYGEVKRNRMDLDGLIALERARVVELPHEALQHYVEATSAVDDGEAAAIAIGISMRIGIATDDGCAIDYWAEVPLADGRRVIGICDILQAAEPVLETEQLREALSRIRRDANFAPPRAHAEWWNRVLNGGR